MRICEKCGRTLTGEPLVFCSKNGELICHQCFVKKKAKEDEQFERIKSALVDLLGKPDEKGVIFNGV